MSCAVTERGSLEKISCGAEEKNGVGEISGFHRGVVSPSLFWDGTQRRMVVTDVSVQLIGPSFKSQTVQEFLLDVTHRRLIVSYGPISFTETFVTNYQSTMRDTQQEFLDSLTFEAGTERLYRNVRN